MIDPAPAYDAPHHLPGASHAGDRADNEAVMGNCQSYQYDVYGEVTGGSGSLANEFEFAGQQTDATGLQYLRARYYDPETGVFLSRDRLAVQVPWVGNGFSYAAGSPTGLTDPDGNKPVSEDGGASARSGGETWLARIGNASGIAWQAVVLQGSARSDIGERSRRSSPDRWRQEGVEGS